MGPNQDTSIAKELVELKEEIISLNMTIKKSSISSDNLTKIMFVVSIMQFIISIFQFIISFAYSDNIQEIIFGVTMIIFTFFVLGYFLNIAFPKK